MWRDKQNLYSEVKPLHCNCGAVARVRYRMPVTWVECKRKCGIKTGYYQDPDAVAKAVEEWNKLVAEKI